MLELGPRPNGRWSTHFSWRRSYGSCSLPFRTGPKFLPASSFRRWPSGHTLGGWLGSLSRRSISESPPFSSGTANLSTILPPQGIREFGHVWGMSTGRSVHNTRDVRVFGCRRRSEVNGGLPHFRFPALNNTQWNHENHRDGGGNHVRTDGGPNVYHSDHGELAAVSLVVV